MNNFALEIWDDESSLVTFYTVRMEGATYSEMEKFIRKFENDTDNETYFDQVMSILLDYIGEHRGAVSEIFNRHENAASALPPYGRIAHELGYGGTDFPLRLYCLRLTDKIVVLFNGGLKTSNAAQDSKGVSLIMKEADKFAQIILKEWPKTIFPDYSERFIINDEDSYDINL